MSNPPRGKRNRDLVLLDADRLRHVRHMKGLKQLSLAHKAGVAKGTLENAEAGKPVRLGSAVRIAAGLGVSVESLIRKQDPFQLPDTLPEGLRRELCSFDLYVNARAARFIGRDFAMGAVVDFISIPATSGFFVIEGKMGTGKSALMAALVAREKLFLHHFNIQLQGIHTARQFLGNICARLIIHYQLPYSKLPVRAYQSGDFLNELLDQAARRRTERDGKPVVIVVDAIDEAAMDGLPHGANVLYLPPVLPDGVFFVVSARGLDSVPLQVSRLRRLGLDANSKENVADLHQYIGQSLKGPGILSWLKKHGIDERAFAATLIQKSEGNFMYLHRVLGAIEDGHYVDSGLEALPDGLVAYYRGHWAAMRSRNPAEFASAYEPIACVLAGSDAAISVHEIAEWTGLPADRVRHVLRDWRQFLDEERSPGQPPRYRLYHSSFKTFLREEVDPDLRTYRQLVKAARSKPRKKPRPKLA